MPTDDNAARYVDLYMLPVPAANLDAYREQATTFGRVALEHGALSYREFRGDDLGESLAVAEDDVLTAAVVEFTSRAHRDEVMGKVMQDARVTALVDGAQIAHMDQMRYGGFELLVQP